MRSHVGPISMVMDGNEIFPGEDAVVHTEAEIQCSTQEMSFFAHIQNIHLNSW